MLPRKAEGETNFLVAEDPDENDSRRIDQVQHEGSSVVSLNSTHRQCHLASILPTTEEEADGTRSLIDFRVYYEFGGYLAKKHFNERNPRVLSHLPERLKDCNIQLSMEMRDSRFSPIYAAQHLLDILQQTHSAQTPAPIALVGAARSAVSQTLSILAGVYELPQISASSTSAALDNKVSSPFFARTVPTNRGDAKATILYLKSLNVTHFGILYIRDEFGTSFNSQLLQEASKNGIQVVSTSFDADRNSIVTGIQQLQLSGLAYFMGIFNPDTWKDVVREASRVGIIGTPKYVWLLSDASQELTQPGFQLDRRTEADLAQAIDGTGVVLLSVETKRNFEIALSELQTDLSLQQEFVAAHVNTSVFHGYNFTFPGSASLYQYLNYDAVMALGIAACEAKQNFFTGPELYQTLVETEFEGVSGLVRFSNNTGTRDEQGVLYNIQNVRIARNQTNGQFYTFQSIKAVEVDFSDNSTPVKEVNTFVYAGGSTTPPKALPPNDIELNLIPQGIRITGFVLGGLSMLIALWWLLWTIYYRNKDVVRIAQPIFLCQLIVGAFIISTAVISMSMQETTVANQHGLDVACMATPWLLSIGFVTAFSALFSKTWRLNKLFRSGQGFRRVQVKARDVILPFLVLSFLNITILIVWTVVAPMTWTRRWTASVDMYGRQIESYGSCYGGQDDRAQYAFLGLILLINIAALVVALYQSYRARNLPTDFNESYYVSVATFSLLESLMLGGPLLVLVHDNPTADFLIKSILIFIICSTILSFMFIPKYLQRNLREMRNSHGRGHKRKGAAARITTVNRHSPFSSPVSRYDSSFAVHGSVTSQPKKSSGARSSFESRGSMENRGSLKSSQKALGQSTICRNENYYLQRRSMEELQNRRKGVFQSVKAVSRGGSSTSASCSSSLKSKPPPPVLGDGNSKVVCKNIASFDPVPAKLQLSFHAIRESGVSRDRSSVESSQQREESKQVQGDLV
jgi:hypothetical protein